MRQLPDNNKNMSLHIQHQSRTHFMRNSILRISVRLIALGLIASSALAQSSSITPSLFIPGDKTIRLASGDQIAPEIASGGNIFLAVWQDKRAFPTSLPSSALEWETSSDIYAMRIDANGKALDPVPIVVTQEAASQKNPQVVWNGTD